MNATLQMRHVGAMAFQIINSVREAKNEECIKVLRFYISWCRHYQNVTFYKAVAFDIGTSCPHPFYTCQGYPGNTQGNLTGVHTPQECLVSH